MILEIIKNEFSAKKEFRPITRTYLFKNKGYNQVCLKISFLQSLFQLAKARQKWEDLPRQKWEDLPRKWLVYQQASKGSEISTGRSLTAQLHRRISRKKMPVWMKFFRQSKIYK